LPLKDVTVQINTPLKGTPLYDRCVAEGEVFQPDTSNYSFFEPVFVPRGMTAEQLLSAHKRFYRRFYLRPGLWWRHLQDVRRPSDITKYFKALPLLANVMFTNQSGG